MHGLQCGSKACLRRTGFDYIRNALIPLVLIAERKCVLSKKASGQQNNGAALKRKNANGATVDHTYTARSVPVAFVTDKMGRDCPPGLVVGTVPRRLQKAHESSRAARTRTRFSCTNSASCPTWGTVAIAVTCSTPCRGRL